MATPCALILSCSDLAASELVKEIVGCSELPPGTAVVDDIVSYPWHIETKYYIADVSLCTIRDKSIGNLEFAESVQAVIVHFDCEQEESFSNVKGWMPFIKEYSAEVQLLVCNKCTDETKVSRTEALQWCLKNGFELIELNPEVEIDGEEDEFAETTGVKRIIQALHAHVWPNLQLKEKGKSENLLQPELLAIGVDRLEDKLKRVSMNEKETIDEAFGKVDLDDEELFHKLGVEDPGGQSFECLFEQFRQMKETAQNLPFEEKKVYAEKVAIAFWRAIGGNDEEVEGLEDEECKNDAK